MRTECDERIYLTRGEYETLLSFNWLIQNIYEIVETEKLKGYCTTILDYLGKLDDYTEIGE